MTLERFEKIIVTLREMDARISNLYSLKFDLIDFVDPYHYVITELIKDIYGDEGYDWFSWFCYEMDFGEKCTPKTAIDKDGSPICYDIESLYEYLNK